MSFTATPRNEATLNNFAANVASSALPATLANSFIVVAIAPQLASGYSTSVTDNLGNTYQMVPEANPGVSQRHVEIWYTQSASAGVTTVTVNNAASANVSGSVTEWPSSLPVVLRSQASLSNASSLTPPAATVPPALGALIIGCMAYQATVASTQQEHLVSGAGYTSLTRQTRGTTSMFAAAYLSGATSTAATGPAWTMDASIATGEVTAEFDQSAVFSWLAAGLSASFDASASAVPSGDTVSGYAWNFGDSTTGSGVSPSHAYGTGGTYTVTLTATYASGTILATTRAVTVVNPAATVGPVALVSAPSWTVTGAGGNAVTATSDADQSTYVVSPASPSGSLFRETLGALITPAAGTDMTVTVEADVTGGTGNLSAKLYEGSTVRAVAAAQTLAVATAGTNTTATLAFTFPASSIANVTNWNALQLELSATAA